MVAVVWRPRGRQRRLCAEYVGVLEYGVQMTACGDTLLLRPRRTKTTVSGSGGLGDDLQPTCHKDSVLSSLTGCLTGSQSSMVCNGTLPDLNVAIARIFLQRCHDGDSDQRCMMIRLGTWISQGQVVNFIFLGSFVQISKIHGPPFVSWSDHICNHCNLFV